MRWLLDTNAWIDLLKNPLSQVRGLLGARAAQVVTCAVVRAELLHGALGYGRPERRLELAAARPHLADADPVVADAAAWAVARLSQPLSTGAPPRP